MVISHDPRPLKKGQWIAQLGSQLAAPPRLRLFWEATCSGFTDPMEDVARSTE